MDQNSFTVKPGKKICLRTSAAKKMLEGEQTEPEGGFPLDSTYNFPMFM